MVEFSNIPEELQNTPQWVMWKLIEKNGKHTKIPYTINNTEASTDKPSTWSTYEEALSAYNTGKFTGIGFVFSKDDHFCGVDWDHIRDPETGEWDIEILEEIESFNSYAEISPSGEGAHVICMGEVPGDRRRKGQREMYDSLRFFTITGNLLGDSPKTVSIAQKALNQVYMKIDPPEQPKSEQPPIPAEAPELTDEQIIALCMGARNADKFEALYDGDLTPYGGDHSRADQAFCNILAFYTNDAAQIDRVFRRSSLYRPKWDEKRGKQKYGERTVAEAIKRTTEKYTAPTTTREEPEVQVRKDSKESQFEIYPEHVVELANMLLDQGDPFKFIVDTWNRHHVGDRIVGEACACAIASTYMVNSKGLHIKPSGDSGKGKSDGAKKFLHLLPSHKKMVGSLSGKSMFYNPNLKKGTVIFTDDVNLSDDIVTTIKQSTTNFQDMTVHNTVKKQEYQQYKIPSRITWWMTSVSGFDDDQMGNRFLGMDVDASAQQDELVFRNQVKMEKFGITDEVVDDSVLICRCIYDMLSEEDFKIIFPYTNCVEWNNKENRRNFPMFMDILKSVALYNFRQREKFQDCYLADTNDFERAKQIYQSLAETNATNLTETELKVMRWLSGQYEVDLKAISGFIHKSEATARRLMHGQRYDGGLLAKVPGLYSQKISVKITEDRITNKNVYRYDSNLGLNSYADVVNLNIECLEKEYHNFKQEYSGHSSHSSSEFIHSSSNVKSEKSDTVSIIKYNILYTLHQSEKKQEREENLRNSHSHSHNLQKCNSDEPDGESGVKSEWRVMKSVKSDTFDQMDKIAVICKILKQTDQIEVLLQRCVESGLEDPGPLIEKLVKNGTILRNRKTVRWKG